MNNKIKIVLISFGVPNEIGKKIQNKAIAEVFKYETYCSTRYVDKIPRNGEKFTVEGGADDFLIFKCVNILTDSNSCNKVEDHSHIILAEFVGRRTLDVVVQ